MKFGLIDDYRYEKNTQLYIMSALNVERDPNYTSSYYHYSLYVARKPWGPWRRVFNNDYNGMSNRAAQDMRYQGGSPDDVHILPDPVAETDPATGDLKVKIWLDFGQFQPLIPPMVFGRTGVLIASMTNPGDLDHIAPWDEFFKQTYYTMCFQQSS